MAESEYRVRGTSPRVETSGPSDAFDLALRSLVDAVKEGRDISTLVTSLNDLHRDTEATITDLERRLATEQMKGAAYCFYLGSIIDERDATIADLRSQDGTEASISI